MSVESMRGQEQKIVFIWVLFRLENLKYSFKRSDNFFHNDDIHIPLEISNFCATFDSKKTIAMRYHDSCIHQSMNVR